MKSKIALLTLCIVGLYATSYAQQALRGSSIDPEEIENPAQLKRLQLRSRKGMKFPLLMIGYPLKKSDFTALNEILSQQSLSLLSVEFAEAPNAELVQNLRDIKVLDMAMQNPKDWIAVKNIPWKSIGYVSFTVRSPEEIYQVPAASVTTSFIEVYQEEEEDMYAYTFEKDKNSCQVLVSKNIVKKDSAQIMNFLASGLGNVTASETEISRDLSVQMYTDEDASQYTGKNAFLSRQSVPLDQWTIDTEKELFLRSSEGTYIFVPADAFVSPGGKPYHGFVNLTYRQWTNTADLFNSKLPLYDYKANGDTVFYITNGMFEIRAYDEEGKELALDKNKSVGVQFPVTEDNKDFNLYAYNEDNKTWDEKGTVAENESPGLFTEKLTGKAPDKTNNSISDSNRIFKYPFDTTRFYNRYYDPSYSNLVDDKQNSGKIPLFDIYSYHSKGFTRKKYNGRNIIRPRLEKVKANDSTFYYRVNFSDHFYDKHPEVKIAYHNRLWIPEGVSKKEFKKDFFKYTSYNDFAFTYTGGHTLNLQLKSSAGFHNVRLQTKYPGNKKTSRIRSSARLFKNYNKYYTKKQKMFDASINRKMSEFIRSAKAFTDDGRPILFATLNINTLGLSNIDHPYIMPQKTKVSPSYVAEGQKINTDNINNVQILDEATFGVFQFDGSQFIYSKKNIEQVVITLHTGQQYIASTEALNILKKGGGSNPELEMFPFEENRSMIPELSMQ